MTFFDLSLCESVIPENAIIHKLVLTQDQAAVLLREGVKVQSGIGKPGMGCQLKVQLN